MNNNNNSLNISKTLKNTALDAPSVPGVYLMKDETGLIIYIGKAKSLKNRLLNYFSGKKDIKTATLMKRVSSIETIIVPSEYDALILENTLIKQHSPKYNINLKDGKTYPVIRITGEVFPRVFRTRRVIKDNSLYFGPFPNVQAVNSMMEIIDKLFPLRKCKRMKLKKTPCMYFHIKRCMAPCCGKITADEYMLHIQHIQKILSGEIESLIIDLTEKMHKEAASLQFEKAAQLRNTIRAIESITGEENSIEDFNDQDRDYIAWASQGVLSTFTVFCMRGGKMTGRDLFRTRSASDESDSLELFLTTYYDKSRLPPLKIFIQNFSHREHRDTENTVNIENLEENKKTNISSVPPCLRVKLISNELLTGWFKNQFGYEPELLAATEKHHEAIIAMARHNAEEDLRKRIKERGAGPALDELMRVLNMKTKPHHIEGFDISHLEGKYPVASLITFKNGIPDKKNYRYFRLRSVIGKADDYAAMREAVRRRYSRLIRESGDLPDLILVDGGIGQVNAASEVLDELGVDCALAGLAERNEELWLKDEKKPLVLPRQSEALKVLQFLRDECHRFALNLNRRLRSKELFFPILESVKGVGPARAAKIMQTYETIANIAEADYKEIAKRCNISESVAKAVRACARNSLSG